MGGPFLPEIDPLARLLSARLLCSMNYPWRPNRLLDGGPESAIIAAPGVGATSSGHAVAASGSASILLGLSRVPFVAETEGSDPQ